MVSTPTTTSFALLGLLGLKPWTAYEMVAQVRRGAHFFWPRSEAHLYAELKRLVERGHAEAETVDGSRRPRTRYSITPEGRAALDDWFDNHTVAAPVIEIEALLRMFLGDQTSAENLVAALTATAAHTRAIHVQGTAVIEDILTTGGPFPHRLHLVEPTAELLDGIYRLLVTWCERTAAEVQAWPSTRDVGLTPETRARLQAVLDAPDP